MESMEDGNLSPDHHGSSEIDLFVMDHISWVIEIVTRFIGHDDPLYIYIYIYQLLLICLHKSWIDWKLTVFI